VVRGFRDGAPRQCGKARVNRRALGRVEVNDKLLGDLAAKLAELAAGNPARDFERNSRALLAAAFAKLDLVPREEYDVQVQVLSRLREQLAALEARVAELEGKRGS